MFSLEFCNIFLKNSKFNWATSIQFFKVSVISYCLEWLSQNQYPDFLLCMHMLMHYRGFEVDFSLYEAPFLDLNLSITNGIVSSKIYDKPDDFNFEIVNFPFLDGDVPRSPSYGVYISQLIRFARVCSNVDDFNNRNVFLTAKLLKQGYRYHKIRKAFSKFYYRHSELIVKYNIGLKTLLQQGISELIFYGDLVYKFKRIVGKPNFSDQFKR